MTDPDDPMRRLDEVMAQLKALGEAQEHVWLEGKFAASPDPSWPPAPNTAHPSLQDMADSVRRTMAKDDCWQVCYAVRRPLKVTDFDTDPSIDDFPQTRVLDVERAMGAAPYVGDRFIYMWRVAVDRATNRWVAGDSWVEYPPAGWTSPRRSR